MSQWVFHYAPPARDFAREGRSRLPWKEAKKSVRCENCGRKIKTGDWPFCPHGKESHA